MMEDPFVLASVGKAKFRSKVRNGHLSITGYAETPLFDLDTIAMAS
jgi:hypothetical protein